VFGGYDIFRETLVRNFWARQPGSRLRPLLVGKLYPDIFKDARLGKSLQVFFSSGLHKTADPFFSHRIRWENTGRIKTFFSEGLRAELGGYDGYEDLESRLPAEYAKWDALSRAQYLEMAVFLSNYLLSSQGDRVAMAHSVEIRLPFLDYRVVEFMGRVPSKWKIWGLGEKYLLKMVLKDLLPPEIVSRPKHPYRAPIRQSLLGEGNGDLADLLSERTVRDAGLFDPRKVEILHRKLRNTPQASEVDSMALAGILSAHLVHDMFVSRFDAGGTSRFAPGIVVDRRTKAA
jgi:asparagine synthase (glutamine-hydrolysing)